MYSEQLEAIIKNVLADGVITDKERAVLHKKAEAEGIDVDEIDVYIEGELDKIRNEQVKAKAQVRKCPACGDIIPVLSNVCPSCGAVVNEVESSDLQLLLQNIENNIVQIKETISSFQDTIGYMDIISSSREKKYAHSKISSEKDIRKARVYYEDNKKVQCLLKELKDDLDTAEKKYNNYKKKKLIARIIAAILFVLPIIPDTVDIIKKSQWDDIYFLLMASPMYFGVGAIAALISYKFILNTIK